jgi:hypothetical protein
VRWSPIDEAKALATLTDSGITVSLEFHFNDEGEAVGVFAPGRYRRVGGGYELTPWEGRFRAYEESFGMRIPTRGEVGWHLTGGWKAVWRGRIDDIRYEFAI